jgi:hypothetical protein
MFQAAFPVLLGSNNSTRGLYNMLIQVSVSPFFSSSFFDAVFMAGEGESMQGLIRDGGIHMYSTTAAIR